MTSEDVIRRALFDARLNATQASNKLDKSAAYVANTMKRKGITVQTMIEILGICGYKLAAIPDDEIPPHALVIDASETD